MICRLAILSATHPVAWGTGGCAVSREIWLRLVHVEKFSKAAVSGMLQAPRSLSYMSHKDSGQCGKLSRMIQVNGTALSTTTTKPSFSGNPDCQ